MSTYFGKSDFIKLKSVYISGLVGQFMIIVVILLGGATVGLFLPNIFSIPDNSSQLIQICFGISIFSLVISILIQYLNTLHSSILLPFIASIVSSLGSITGVITTVILLISGKGLYSLPAGFLTGLIVSFCILALLTVGRYRKLPDKAELSKSQVMNLLTETGPIFLGKTGQTLVKQIEPIIITILIGPVATTAFVITKRAADFLAIAINIVLGATFPSITNLISSDSIEKVNNVLSKLFYVFVIFSSVGFLAYYLMNGYFITLWVGNEYYLGYLTTAFIAIGIIMRLFLNLSTDIIFAGGEIKYSSLIQFFEAIFRIILMFGFVYLFGTIGAPIGLVVSCLFFLMIVSAKYKGSIYYELIERKLEWQSISIYLFYLFIFSFVMEELHFTIDTWYKLIIYGIITICFMLAPTLLIKSMRRKLRIV